MAFHCTQVHLEPSSRGRCLASASEYAMGPRHCMAVKNGDLEVPAFSFSAAYFTLTLASQLCGGLWRYPRGRPRFKEKAWQGFSGHALCRASSPTKESYVTSGVTCGWADSGNRDLARSTKPVPDPMSCRQGVRAR